MAAEKTDDYEHQERAAIREFEGCYPRDRADQLAFTDLQERKLNEKILQRQQQRNTLEELRARREEIGSRMRAEQDPQREKELFQEWMDLCNQIIQLRKES